MNILMSYRVNKFFRRLNWQLEYLLSLPLKLVIYFNLYKIKDGFPDFLIIGLPKSASWWLAQMIDKNPSFFLGSNPNGKWEIRYFSVNFNKNLNFYLKIFQGKTKYLKFEKSPDYSIISEFRIRLLKKLNPDIKIILMYRDPIERGFSHAKMDLLRRPGKRFDEVSLERFRIHYHHTAISYNYEEIYKKWNKYFDEKHLLVVLMDSIIADPIKVLEEVHDFLDVPFQLDYCQDISAVNKTQIIDMPENHYNYLQQVNDNNIKFYNKLLQKKIVKESLKA
ncbi:hypothetical protein BH23BAC1_BH23BAC1_48780 [soil metagenome]